jgi:hypothetical protein
VRPFGRAFDAAQALFPEEKITLIHKFQMSNTAKIESPAIFHHPAK